MLLEHGFTRGAVEAGEVGLEEAELLMREIGQMAEELEKALEDVEYRGLSRDEPWLTEARHFDG